MKQRANLRSPLFLQYASRPAEAEATNLVQYSEEFDNAYYSVFNGASVANGIDSPDGNQNAYRLESNGSNFSFMKVTTNITVTSGQEYTFSIFVKKGQVSTGYLRLDFGTYIYNRKFDLSTSTFSTGFDNTGNIPSSETIEYISKGWYRISITDTVDTTSFETRIYVTGTSGATLGDSIYIFGAQLEEGSQATSYIKTEGTTVTRAATTAAQEEDVTAELRIYNGGGGYDYERTNYALNSTQLHLNNTLTSTATITKTGNYAISPDGTLTATRLQASGTSGYALLSVNGTNPTIDGNGGGYYRSSVYVKSNTDNTQTIVFYGSSTQTPITHEIGNEWERIDFLAYRPSGSKYAYLGLHINNGSDTDLDFLAWGGQTELNDLPVTSFIPTEATAVTELAYETEAPTEATYTLTRTPNNAKATFEVSELVRDYIEQTLENTSGTTWLEVTLSDSIQLPRYYHFLCTEGYIDNTEGLQTYLNAPSNETFMQSNSTVLIPEGESLQIPINAQYNSFYSFDLTNQLEYSEDFSNGVWSLLAAGTGSSPSVTSNYSLSPNGDLTADRVILDQGAGTSSGDYSIIRQVVSSIGQGVSSVYMKSNTDSNYVVGIDETGLGSKDVTVTPNWQRFEFSDSSADRLQISLRGGTNSNYADISVWGGQLEVGTQPTSYVKTESINDSVNYFSNLDSNETQIEYITVQSNSEVLRLHVDSVVTEEITIKEIDCSKYANNKLLFVNKYGAKQEFYVNMKSTEKIRVKDDGFSRNVIDYANLSVTNGLHSYKRRVLESKEMHTLNTPFLDEENVQAFEELLLSEYVWYKKEGGDYIPVIIKDSNMTRKTHLNDKLIQYTIEVESANNLINIQR